MKSFPSLEELERRYRADVYKPGRFSAIASTGVGISEYLHGHMALGLTPDRAVRRLEKGFIRHACKDSLKQRMRDATVAFSTWPSFDGEAPYRQVEINEGKVVADQRTPPSWDAR